MMMMMMIMVAERTRTRNLTPTPFIFTTKRSIVWIRLGSARQMDGGDWRERQLREYGYRNRRTPKYRATITRFAAFLRKWSGARRWLLQKLLPESSRYRRRTRINSRRFHLHSLCGFRDAINSLTHVDQREKEFCDLKTYEILPYFIEAKSFKS